MDNRLVITEDLVIILPVWARLLITCYTLLYVFGQTDLSKQYRLWWDASNAASHQCLHCLPLIQLFLVGSKLYLFKFQIMYDKELRCPNTKGKYGKVTNTEIKWSIISKSVMIIIFVEFIDQLIDYPIKLCQP